MTTRFIKLRSPGSAEIKLEIFLSGSPGMPPSHLGFYFMIMLLVFFVLEGTSSFHFTIFATTKCDFDKYSYIFVFP